MSSFPPPAVEPEPYLAPICPRCQMKVPKGASVCAHCKKRLRTSLPILYLVAALGALFFLWTSGSLSTDSPPRMQPPPEEAQRAAEKASAAPEEASRAEEEAFLKTNAGKIWRNHKDWSREICKTVANHQIQIGMTAEQVRIAWGQPKTINSATTARRTYEQWVYGIGQYVYFENGILTSVQQSK